MPKIDRNINAPYQGVTEAAQTIRLEDQMDSSVNCIARIPNGITKRPPFKHTARLATDVTWSTNARIFPIERGIDLPDVALVVQNEMGAVNVRVVNLSDGTQEAVNVSPTAQAYLNTGSPYNTTRDIRLLTVADTTFILNRNVEVQQGASSAPVSPFEALIRVRQAAFARTYSVTITQGASTFTASYLTPDGSTTASGEFIDTDNIAAILLNATANGVVPDAGSATSTLGADLIAAGFTVTLVGSVIAIQHPSTDFTIEVTDGQAGEALVPIKDEVQDFSDLPQTAIDGFKVLVTNTSAGNEDDYYVEFQSTAGATGVWTETIAPGVNLGADPATLPLTVQFDGVSWMVDAGSWSGRTVGDLQLSPDPGFVGNKLTDITFWRGRLGILYNEDIFFAAADNPFSFYASTLVTSLDSDPFGLNSPLDRRSNFLEALAFKRRLVIFSEQAQFVVTAEGPLVSASTAEIDVSTRYRYLENLEPQGSNSKAYFGADRGNNSTVVYELDVNDITNTEDADDLTFHIPTLLPSNLNIAATAPTEFVTCYATQGSNDWFVHIYRHAEGERIQNGWFPQKTPNGMQLVDFFFINTEMFVFLAEIDNPTRVHLSTVSFAPEDIDDDPTATVLTYLDMRQNSNDVTAVYDSITDTTAIGLLFPSTEDVSVVARAPGGEGGRAISGSLPTVFEGQAAIIDSVDAGVITVQGDWSLVPFHLGYLYTSDWTPNQFYARDQSNSVIRTGRLRIDRLLIDVSDSGFQEIIIGNGQRDLTKASFQGYIYGDRESVIGRAPNQSTILDKPVAARSDQLTITFSNKSHFSSRITGYEWVGTYSPRAGRTQ